ncbi:uncharacterized protein I303_105903 [Kwoniella dejecticola CBS 10117]|uniref:Pinin/SDK/MemA protein domain-containing protein n=1 Tax=Kwoniella dejecticola CBS 10117 TaxID=1296121 RepID=A0A1A6A0S4_9TREE|nr:uncharacterized protein I303_05926 [Kwoniella dejecticola CBS 10117]OBR83646.1 hypothetical protein I303_05926 [Kwoniella dejecticola CBS 10117]
MSPSLSPSRSRRPDIEEEAPAKRMRTDRKVEDKARGKRLFGNILGTLQKFQKDDKSSRTSEAAKRREQVSERIAAKLRSETTLHNDIAESEKEIKTLKISVESSEYILKHKEVALKARHDFLKPTSKFLYTSLPPDEPLIFETHLVNPSPIPLSKGPSREPPHGKELAPLYYLPKILLPSQSSALRSRQANIQEIITEETDALRKEKEEVRETAIKNKDRIQELQDKLIDLRKQVKNSKGDAEEHEPGPGPERSSRRNRDDFGRTPREEMDIDQPSEKEKEKVKEEEKETEEQGVVIKGDEGDIEVEY